MPIYGYACKNCEHTLDALQKMRTSPWSIARNAANRRFESAVTAPKFRLKGQGWYETDFKTGNQRNIAGDKEPPVAKSKEIRATRPRHEVPSRKTATA